MWSEHPDCINVIKEVWSTKYFGFPMFILSQKLKLLKSKLKIWNKEHFGNVHDMLRKAEADLYDLQL